MGSDLKLPALETEQRSSISDQVFDHLHQGIMSLDLRPGTKISEVEVARQMGVSRQPVRDAFYRLSKLGFLVIRPQRATTISLISSAAVLQARFIRTALELETVRRAAEVLTPADIVRLEEIVARQLPAVEARDRKLFHSLDDRFHQEIALRAGLGFTWDLIREYKSHMDRVRMLSLSFALPIAYQDHLTILDALKARSPDAAADALRNHLGRIQDQLKRIRDDNQPWFEDEEG